MKKFANFEFRLAIRGPKLAWGVVQDKLIKHKIGGFFSTCTFGMTWRGLARGPIHPHSNKGLPDFRTWGVGEGGSFNYTNFYSRRMDLDH